MVDGPCTKNRQTRLLEHDASTDEANAWLKEFEKYFADKEVELLKRGYQPVEHGRMILNAYIDRHLENRLNHDEPPGAGLPVGGAQGCTARLKRYFSENAMGNSPTQSRMVTPTDPAPEDDKWLLIDLMNHHDDFSGGKATQAREHEQFKRRKEYAGTKKLRHPASVPSVKQHTTITDLPNEIL